jgi:tRNA A-37 threonylcarbamoyl transferase component Bud32
MPDPMLPNPPEDRFQTRSSMSRWMRLDASLPPALAQDLWRDPDVLLASGTMLKDGDRSTVVRLDAEGRSFVLKRYNMRGPAHTFIHALMRSRARWSLINGLRATGAGLCTPRPLACLERRCGPLRGRSYFMCEFIDGEPLLTMIRGGAVDPPRLERLAAGVGEIWAALGRARLSHGDMKATNFIVDANDALWMVDLDGMRRERIEAWWRRQRARDRARFMKNWRGRGSCEEVFLACVDTA